MTKLGFYLMGKKGYKSLLDFINIIGPSKVSYVCSSTDLNVKKDFYAEIESLCKFNSIEFFHRSQEINIKSDYIIAIGWRWIIHKEANVIVFHDSLLPKYRGFSPLVNALINGESEIGVTALKASAIYDAGPIVAQASLPISYPIKINDAIEKVSLLYSDLLIDLATKLIEKSALCEYLQDEGKASFSPWRNDADYFISWKENSEKIARFVDATGYPYGGARTKIGGTIVTVEDVEVIDDVAVEDRSSHVGKVLFMENGMPVVICGIGLVKLISIHDENGSSMIGKLPFRTKFGA